MNREERIRLKLALIAAGLVVLAALFVIQIGKMKKVNQKEGEYIPLYQVLLLIETVNPTIAEQEEYAALKDADGGFMTYRQYRAICGLLSREDAEFPDFVKEYEEDFFVTKEDFETMLALFLKAYDQDNKLQTKPVTILGFQGNIVLGDGTEPEKGTLAAEDGLYEVEDEEIYRYRFRTIEAYIYENRLVTVKEEINTDFGMENIWVMESDKEGIRFYFDGYEALLANSEIDENMKEKIEREQVADFTFKEGILTSGKSKTEKINGKILNVKEQSIILEGKGEFQIADSFKAYRLYGTLEEIGKEDLIVGYDFTDFVVENGKVCAGLVIKEEKMEYIRVLLKTSDYAGMFHESLEFTSDSDFTVSYGIEEQRQTEKYKAGERAVIEAGSGYFTGQRVYISPDVLSGKIRLLNLNRNQGTPEYRGKIELALEEGKILAVNEVLLEEYLYSVVPSEMPASYPEEALKAQAVCARTYAYEKMLHSPLAAYGAHVDDSTSYQVYNNIAESAAATKAVKETSGKLLFFEEELAGTYYYSTSCGYGTTSAVWNNNPEAAVPYLNAKAIGEGGASHTAEEMAEEEIFKQFIQETKTEDFESEESWYRWSYTVEEIDSEKMEEILKKRYDANNARVLTLNKEGEYESCKIKNIGKIKDIYVEKRLPGGVADELIIVAEHAQIKVITEYNIRCVLNNGTAKVRRQDGSEAAAPSLLPSAFFVISTSKDGEDMVGYTMTGGGYGHGVGMSQNGAKSMASRGYSCEEILTFFYEGSTIEAVY